MEEALSPSEEAPRHLQLLLVEMEKLDQGLEEAKRQAIENSQNAGKYRAKWEEGERVLDDALVDAHSAKAQGDSAQYALNERDEELEKALVELEEQRGHAVDGWDEAEILKADYDQVGNELADLNQLIDEELAAGPRKVAALEPQEDGLLEQRGTKRKLITIEEDDDLSFRPRHGSKTPKLRPAEIEPQVKVYQSETDKQLSQLGVGVRRLIEDRSRLKRLLHTSRAMNATLTQELNTLTQEKNYLQDEISNAKELDDDMFDLGVSLQEDVEKAERERDDLQKELERMKKQRDILLEFIVP